MQFHSLPPCQRCKGYVSRTSSLHSMARVCRAGLSAPFSSHSCLIVFIQRAPGSHSPDPLAISSSPPALEHLLPAPVYLALLPKPHLYKPTRQQITEKKVSRAQIAVMSLAYVGSLKDQQMGLAAWDAVGSNAQEMSLFQCSGSYF